MLEMARARENLRGVVSVHGVLETAAPANAGAVKADVLVLTGGADPFVTKDQVDELDRELEIRRSALQDRYLSWREALLH